MLTQHIALVPEGNGVNASDLARVSAALQKQVVRDLAPLWGISATVDAFPTLEDVPVGYWPIVVTFRQLGRDAGVRIDRNGQPYALVEVAASWSLHASRACLEMLVNPSGNRSVTTVSPRADQGPVELLVEVCSACDDARYAYVINDVLVADFCTPAYYGTGLGLGRLRYTANASASAPFELLPGGHLTWYDPVSDSWWTRAHSEESVVDTELGSIERPFSSVRELASDRAPRRLAAGGLSIEAFAARMGVVRQHAFQASQYRSHRLRAQLAGPSTQWPATIDVGHARQDMQSWPLTAASRARESSAPPAPAVAASRAFEKSTSMRLTPDAERKRAEEHFDLLMEALQDAPVDPSSETDETELRAVPSEAVAVAAAARPSRSPTEALRSNPPPLPRASAKPAPRTAVPQPAPRRAHPEPGARTGSPALMVVLVACVCLAVGWGAQRLLGDATSRPTDTRSTAKPSPERALTTTVSAATQPAPSAPAPLSAEPRAESAPAANGTLQATTAAAVAPAPATPVAASASPPPVPTSGHAVSSPELAQRAVQPAAKPHSPQPGNPVDTAVSSQELVASTKHHGRPRPNGAQPSPAPASPSSTAAASGASLDDLLDSRR